MALDVSLDFAWLAFNAVVDDKLGLLGFRRVGDRDGLGFYPEAFDSEFPLVMEQSEVKDALTTGPDRPVVAIPQASRSAGAPLLGLGERRCVD